MNDKLYEWLRKEFYYSNHPKYRHLFEEWVRNITQSQIDGFRRQMINKENNIQEFMVQVNFEHFTIGTKLYAYFSSQIKIYVVTEVSMHYNVDVNGKARIWLAYDLQNVERSSDTPRILDSDINKVYFSSEQELLKYIVGQMN